DPGGPVPRHTGSPPGRRAGDHLGIRPVDWTPYDAVLFDLDGVLTPTAEVHMRAWAELSTAYLAERGAAPIAADDYYAHIDGRPRYEGVAELLADRGITLPEGDPSDAPGTETVCGLGNRKNEVFAEVLEREGITPYLGSVGSEERGVGEQRRAHLRWRRSE